jgi:hypothetical protein
VEEVELHIVVVAELEVYYQAHLLLHMDLAQFTQLPLVEAEVRVQMDLILH